VSGTPGTKLADLIKLNSTRREKENFVKNFVS
jgi:hypothetical protein